MLLLLLRLWEENVIDGYVDFRNPQSHQVLDLPYNVAVHRFGDLRYGPAVLYGQREVDVDLLFADLHRDAAGGATAHLYPFDLLRCDAGDLGDDGVAYGGVAALGLKRWPFLLLPLPAARPSFGQGVLLLPTRLLLRRSSVSTVGMMPPNEAQRISRTGDPHAGKKRAAAP